MQIIRLVKSGEVDKIIGFDTLPKSLMSGVRTNGTAGFPRHWGEWLLKAKCFRKAQKWTEDHDVEFDEPCFYFLEYVTVNKDKERWQEIVNYTRKECDPSMRLLDKFEDMAVRLAPDSYAPLSLEPEEIPIIKIEKVPVESKPVAPAAVAVEPVDGIKEESKKRGRPRKEAVPA